MITKNQRVGEKVKCSTMGEVYYSYLPKPLPPVPAIEMEQIYPYLDQANIALGRLEGLSVALPDPSLFLYMYIRKEAVLSSQIEGTQSTLSDLLLYENQSAPSVPNEDVAEVSNYVAAMEHGLKRIKGGFPLSLRLIKEMHEVLLNHGRGCNKQPGEFRRSQNWLGGTRPGNAKFVPPSPEKIMECLGSLEKFLHDEENKLPVLLKAALAHHQFETIHPFLDGNGRLGRLLITFILCVDGVLQEPLLYLSYYFKQNRQSYYDHLQIVRDTGDWEEWLLFFLKGVIDTANQAVETAQSIVALFKKDQEKIEQLGKAASSALLVHNYFKKHIITGSRKISKDTEISQPTINKAIEHLVALDIVQETTGRSRNQIFVYKKYIGILNEGAL